MSSEEISFITSNKDKTKNTTLDDILDSSLGGNEINLDTPDHEANKENDKLANNEMIDLRPKKDLPQNINITNPPETNDELLKINNNISLSSMIKDQNKNSFFSPIGFSSIDSKGSLNEPIWDSLKRDLIRIIIKLYFVLNPFTEKIRISNKYLELLHWDLWGPLFFNILLSITLSFHNDDKGQAFVVVFTIFWVGSFLIYLNSNLLGCKLNLFQIICLIGYCMFPLNLIAIILAIFNFYEIIRIVLLAFGIFWASYSAIGYVKNAVPSDKKLLLIYPILLEYLFICGIILMN